MRGFPKNLNSKKDYKNIIDDFGYSKKVKEAYQGLLNTTTKWKFDKLLESKEDGDSGDDYKIMEETFPIDSNRIIQYKLVDNPDGKLYKLGFKINEVKEVIAKCEE